MIKVHQKANVCATEPVTPLIKKMNGDGPTSAQQSLNSNETYNKIRQKSNPARFSKIVQRSLRHSREVSLASAEI